MNIKCNKTKPQIPNSLFMFLFRPIHVLYDIKMSVDVCNIGPSIHIAATAKETNYLNVN